MSTCRDAAADGVHCEGPVVVGLCDTHSHEWADLLHERAKQRAAIPNIDWDEDRILQDVLVTAADLVSEDGENPEYDRALVELLLDLTGTSTEDDHRAWMLAHLRETRSSRA